MSASKLKWTRVFSCRNFAIVMILMAACYGIRSAIGYAQYCRTHTPNDLTFRYNESLCAHTGINPFRVWSQELESDSFRKFDLKTTPDDLRKPVHNYPPWHMTFTWFFGSTSIASVIAYLYTFNGAALVLLLMCLWRIIPKEERMFVWGFLFFVLAVPIAWCYWLGNYGIIIAALLLVLMIFVCDNHQVCGGAVWALMMIKPQSSLLFLFPLLVKRKFITVIVAGTICAFATLWPSFVYGESPVELILQIPRTGAPYGLGVDFVARVSQLTHLPILMPIWSVFCFLLCGWHTWRLRKSENLLVVFAPAAFLFTVWTYSNKGDLMIAWPFLIVMARMFYHSVGGLFSVSFRKAVIVFLLLIIVTYGLTGLWNMIYGARMNPVGVVAWCALVRNLAIFAMGNAVLFMLRDVKGKADLRLPTLTPPCFASVDRET